MQDSWPAKPRPVEEAPGRPRLTAKGKATRQRIISAASQAFSERGVTASSNDDILAVAGASHSQLYHYFTDRDDLVAAVIADRVEQFLSHQISLLADVDSIEAYDSGVTPPLRCSKTPTADTDAQSDHSSVNSANATRAAAKRSPPHSNGGTTRSATDSSKYASWARSARQPMPTALRSPFSP
jgi:AcrR family transcriptional regulator